MNTKTIVNNYMKYYRTITNWLQIVAFKYEINFFGIPDMDESMMGSIRFKDNLEKLAKKLGKNYETWSLWKDYEKLPTTFVNEYVGYDVERSIKKLIDSENQKEDILVNLMMRRDIQDHHLDFFIDEIKEWLLDNTPGTMERMMIEDVNRNKTK